ncbi:MAG TPA: glycosyltransferase family 1 protein [Bryobacteraceae bacterium]|nr:glycosyltransferase family 1 protein [Bryobacteraceae bacterium]HOQ46722.1 glycosyltransferase family 1 protein [Bryobacteraceae bacterium]HPU72392.1 glycosyltransferase family 1 protein [Bryobacteraceae bacterium]
MARIVIDATSLLLRSAGVKTYIYHWVRALRCAAVQDSIRLFPFYGDIGALDHEASCAGKLQTILGKLAVHFSNTWCNPVLEAVGCAADVFHASQHLRNPPYRFTKLTATIHDMTCWLMPEVHTPANVKATLMHGDRVLRRAAALIAVSEQSKQDAVDVLGLPAERIEVIYPGVAEQYFQAGPLEAQAAARKYGLEKPYILFVSTIEPRKNVDRLLDAYQSVCPQVREEYELVIAGALGWCSEATAKRLCAETRGIRYLGYIPESDLPGLTAGAAMFLFPSLYEGFGLPLAQAMACGVPSITSRNSSLREVAGDGAFLVEPTNTEEIASAIETLALSSLLAQDLGRRGRLRASIFRWERNAQQSLAFFHRVAGI